MRIRVETKIYELDKLWFLPIELKCDQAKLHLP